MQRLTIKIPRKLARDFPCDRCVIGHDWEPEAESFNQGQPKPFRLRCEEEKAGAAIEMGQIAVDDRIEPEHPLVQIGVLKYTINDLAFFPAPFPNDHQNWLKAR